jgi:hypothetical protein
MLGPIPVYLNQQDETEKDPLGVSEIGIEGYDPTGTSYLVSKADDALTSDTAEMMLKFQQLDPYDTGEFEGQFLSDQEREDLNFKFKPKDYLSQLETERYNSIKDTLNTDEGKQVEINKRNAMQYYDDVYNCLGGQCDNPYQDIVNNRESEWRYDTLQYNRPLIESLYRTYGAYDLEGNVRNPQVLLDQFMRDGAQRLVNITKLGADVLDSDLMTEQQKKDLAFQLLSYEKVAATGEGSRPALSQTADIVGGLITDPTNVLFGGAKPLAQATVGQLGKKGLLDWAKKIFTSEGAKAAGKGGTVAGLYVGFDEFFRQKPMIDAGILEKADWGRLTTATGIGIGMGTGLSLLLFGGSTALNNSMNKWMVDNNLTNKEALSMLRDNMDNEVKLYKFLKNLGWSKKDVETEIKFLREGGWKWNDEAKAWVNTEGVKHKNRMDVRKGEAAFFKGEDVKGTMAPNELIANAQKVLDDEYAVQYNKEIEIPFRKYGQKMFDFLNRVLGDGINWIYGTDAVLVRSGLRKYATGISDAMATSTINSGRITRGLKDFIKANKNDLGEDLNALWRNRNDRANYNPAQRELIERLEKIHKQQLRNAVRNKVITLDEYKKFIKDTNYVPRVWNTQHLVTKKGAQEFSDFLMKLWKTDPQAARQIIDNITQNKKLTDEVIDARFNKNAVASMFRNKADREMSVERSAHLEKGRKIKVAPKYEPLLDQFMAPFEDRWAMYFDDVLKRNEFASRFGAKDEKVVDKIKQLRKEGKGRIADNLQEIYFATVKDTRSKTVADNAAKPALSRGISKINAYQTVDKLGLASVLNATQGFVNGITNMMQSGGGIKSFITAPARAVMSMLNAMAPKLTPKRLDIIHKSGVLGEIDMAKIVNESGLQARIIEKEFKGPLRWLNEPTQFLRKTGFIPVEAWNRRTAAIMAHGHIQDLHAQLQRLISKGKGGTRRAIKLEKQLRNLGINNAMSKKDLTANDITIGVYNMNKDVNFSGESFNLPTKWHGPYGKLFTKFKSFMFFQSRFIKRRVLDPLLIEKNPVPAIAYLTAAGVAGNTAGDIRNWMSGREEDDAHNREMMAWIIRGLQNAGGMGLFFETMKGVQEEGPGAIGSDIAGPTVSDAFYVGKDLLNFDFGKAAERMLVPNVPFKEQIKELMSY